MIYIGELNSRFHWQLHQFTDDKELQSNILKFMDLLIAKDEQTPLLSFAEMGIVEDRTLRIISEEICDYCGIKDFERTDSRGDIAEARRFISYFSDYFLNTHSCQSVFASELYAVTGKRIKRYSVTAKFLNKKSHASVINQRKRLTDYLEYDKHLQEEVKRIGEIIEKDLFRYVVPRFFDGNN